MTSFTKGAEAMREMAAKIKALALRAEKARDALYQQGKYAAADEQEQIRKGLQECLDAATLPLPSQPEDSSARDVVIPSMAGEPGYILKNATAPQQNAVPREDAVRKLLKGIDETEGESDDGWWETTTGAEFGRAKLEELLALLKGAP